MPNNRNKLIYTLREQLRSELAMGGKWLPKGAEKIIPDPVTEKTAPEAENPTPTETWSPTPAAANVRPIPQSQPLNHPAPVPKESEPEPAFMTEKVKAIMNKKQKLKAIAEEIAQCRNCTLAETRTNVVPGEGNPNAKLVFVGEAPGKNEDEQGRPFIGRAGKLLDNIIAAMGLTRDDIYICNILKCRPPGNRDPLPAEVEVCRHFLYEQLNALDPEVIVALGTHAAHTLLETKTPIGQLRGKMHEYHPAGLNKPIKLAATYHPAYLLRNYNPDTRTKVWEDMKKVLKELGLPVPKAEKK